MFFEWKEGRKGRVGKEWGREEKRRKEKRKKYDGIRLFVQILSIYFSWSIRLTFQISRQWNTWIGSPFSITVLVSLSTGWTGLMRRDGFCVLLTHMGTSRILLSFLIINSFIYLNVFYWVTVTLVYRNRYIIYVVLYLFVDVLPEICLLVFSPQSWQWFF